MGDSRNSDGAGGDGGGGDTGRTAANDRGAGWLATVAAGYDEVADAYDDQRDPEAERPVLRSFDETLASGSLVVDAGCGGGRAGLETLAERHEVVGVDLSRAQLGLARERVPEARLLQGELTTLPLADGVADALCSLHAVIHVPRERHDAVFAEFARVLRPGGELLVTCGTGPWEGRNDDWTEDLTDGDDGERAGADDASGPGAPMQWSFHGDERTKALLRDAGFEVGDGTVLGDELGGGEWLYLRARLVE